VIAISGCLGLGVGNREPFAGGLPSNLVGNALVLYNRLSPAGPPLAVLIPVAETALIALGVGRHRR
jgi:hypothetical protein